MALKHSLQVESTSWLVVTNRNYYNGFSSRETLLWAQGHLASPQEPQDIRTLPRPFMTDEEDHTGAMTYPGSQNINGSKAGLRGLGTCQVFPRASMYNWASYALCSLEAICISPGFPFLLVKSWPHAKWPGFCLCVREEVISRTWLTPVLWEAFSELQIGLYIPHFWFSVRLPCPWDSPSKSTGVGCHWLLQIEIFGHSKKAKWNYEKFLKDRWFFNVSIHYHKKWDKWGVVERQEERKTCRSWVQITG